MRTRLRHPSPAMVVALIALFVAMGGTGYAAATGSIDSREIKNSSIQGKDIKNSSLTGSDVKTSGLTGSDVKANSLTGSDIEEGSLGQVPSAASAGTANSAGNASALGNVPPSGYQKTGLPPFTAATLQNGWTRFANSFSPPGYWIDASGVVNLQGSLNSGTVGQPVFTLPVGVRPTTYRSYTIRCSGGPGVVEISNTDGGIRITNIGASACASYAFLDGLTYRPDN